MSNYLSYLRLRFPNQERFLCHKRIDASSRSSLFGVYDASFKQVTFDGRMYEPISEEIKPVDTRLYNLEHVSYACVYPTHDLVYYDLKLWVVVACDGTRVTLHQLKTVRPAKKAFEISLHHAVHAHSLSQDCDGTVHARLVGEDAEDASGISALARVLGWLKSDWYLHSTSVLTLQRTAVFPKRGAHLYLRFGCALKKHPGQARISPFALSRPVADCDEELDLAVSLDAITKTIAFRRVRLVQEHESPRVDDLPLFCRVYRYVPSTPTLDLSVNAFMHEPHTTLPQSPFFLETSYATLVRHNLLQTHERRIDPDCLSLWSSSFASPLHSWWLQATSVLMSVQDALWTSYSRKLCIANDLLQEEMLHEQDANFLAQWRYRIRLCVQVFSLTLQRRAPQKMPITACTAHAYAGTVNITSQDSFATRTMDALRSEVIPPSGTLLVKTETSPSTRVFFTILKLFGTTASSTDVPSDALHASFRLRVQVNLIEHLGTPRETEEQQPTFSFSDSVLPFFGGIHAGSLSVFSETPTRDGVVVPDDLLSRSNYTPDVLIAADNILETLFPSSPKVQAQWYAYLSNVLGEGEVRDVSVIGSHVPILSPEHACSPRISESAQLIHEVIDVLLAIHLKDGTHRCIAVYTTPVFANTIDVTRVPCHYASAWSLPCFYGTVHAMLHIWAVATSRETIGVVHASPDAEGFACQTGDFLCSYSHSFPFCCRASMDAFTTLSECVLQCEARPCLPCPETDLFHTLLEEQEAQTVYLYKEPKECIYLLHKKPRGVPQRAVGDPQPAPEPQDVPEPAYRSHEVHPVSFDVNERVYPANEAMQNRNLRVQINIAVEQAAGFLMSQANQAWAPFRAFLGNGSNVRRGWIVRQFFETTRANLNGITGALPIAPNQDLGGPARAQDSGRNGYPYADSLTHVEAQTAILRLSVRAIHRSMNDKLLRAHDLALAGQQQVNVTQAPFHYPNAPGMSVNSLARETMSNSQRASMRLSALQEIQGRIAQTRDALRQLVVQTLPMWVNLAPV